MESAISRRRSPAPEHVTTRCIDASEALVFVFGCLRSERRHRKRRAGRVGVAAAARGPQPVAYEARASNTSRPRSLCPPGMALEASRMEWAVLLLSGL
eukprot:821747-Pleurochrysis_carterae.AAC.2